MSPQGETPLPYTFDFANMKPTQYAGGTVKIADSRNFNVAKTIAVAEVTVEPGAMRELHVSSITQTASPYDSRAGTI